MFNDSFYPTTDYMIGKMIAPYKQIYNLQILEPQAGKGNIVDYLINSRNARQENIFCIEIEEELRMILQGKKYRVIDSDFLAYSDTYHFDLILMNPPFDQGAKHLLKAWDILNGSGGDIACILNAETIRNPYSEERKLLLRIIAAHGRYEFFPSAFQHAERKTAIDVAIVWLKKHEEKPTVEFGGDYDKDGIYQELEHNENALASRDLIKSLVAQYEGARAALIETHKYQSKYRFYVSGVVKLSDQPAMNKSLNTEIDGLKKYFWDYVFTKTKIAQYTTSKFQEKFYKFRAENATLAFSLNNVIKCREFFMNNLSAIVEDCLLQVFDTATAYHEKNQIHTEGWKTNKSWKCNRKIIVPWGVNWSNKYGESWDYAYQKMDFYRDFDKVLCFISGQKFEDIQGSADAIQFRCNFLNKNLSRYDEKFDSEFFTIRFFKKGTVHLEFKDEHIWAQFNQRAAKGKNWIGGGY